MRTFRLLLLALVFVLSTTASAVASVHKCCPDAACDIVHCIAMECAPALPAFAFNKPPALPAVRADQAPAVRPALPPPDRYEEVWTPPD